MGRIEHAWFASVSETLSPSLVEPVVRDMLGSADARVTSVGAAAMDYTNVDPDRRLLVRVTGEAEVAGSTAPWSLVLKGFRRPTDAGSTLDDPTHYDYWEREPRFFESGMWAGIGPGIRSVRCHGVQRWSEREVWLWLEDVVASPEGHWPEAAFEQAAYDLGRFAGSFVAGGSLPGAPWLADTRSVQTRYSVDEPQMRAVILRAIDGPGSTGPATAKAFGSAADRATLRAAFLRQGALLDAIDRLPRALCHNDTMAANLFVVEGGAVPETVVIDWALVGVGPAGGDLGQLVPGSACFFRSGTDRLDALDRRTFEAYLTGMTESGASVDAQDVRFASLVTQLAQWTAIVAFHLALALDPAEEEWVHGFWHRPPRDVVEQFTPLLAFLTRRAEETLRHERAPGPGG